MRLSQFRIFKIRIRRHFIELPGCGSSSPQGLHLRMTIQKQQTLAQVYTHASSEIQLSDLRVVLVEKYTRLTTARRKLLSQVQNAENFLSLYLIYYLFPASTKDLNLENLSLTSYRPTLNFNIILACS
jgi:hypothetical protein